MKIQKVFLYSIAFSKVGNTEIRKCKTGAPVIFCFAEYVNFETEEKN